MSKRCLKSLFFHCLFSKHYFTPSLRPKHPLYSHSLNSLLTHLAWKTFPPNAWRLRVKFQAIWSRKELRLIGEGEDGLNKFSWRIHGTNGINLPILILPYKSTIHVRNIQSSHGSVLGVGFFCWRSWIFELMDLHWIKEVFVTKPTRWSSQRYNLHWYNLHRQRTIEKKVYTLFFLTWYEIIIPKC